MKDLVLIGAGGFGREVVTYINDINAAEPTWNLLGFIDDFATETPEGYPVIGTMETLLAMDPKPYFAVPIANSQVREQLVNRCLEAGMKPATLIHPDSKIGDKNEIGEGCIICREFSTGPNVTIGAYSIVNVKCAFGHDAYVEPYNTFMSEALIAGETYIDKHCYIGLRCTMINRVKVTQQCTFGACCCIVRDAVEPGTYVGVPAKLIKPLQK